MFDSCISSRFPQRDKLRYSCQIRAGCSDHCAVRERWQIEDRQIPGGNVEAIWSSMWRWLSFGRFKSQGGHFRSF